MRSRSWRNIPLHIVLICISLVTLFPFVWMISTSLKDSALVFSYPPKLIPNPLNWVNYQTAWNESNMGRALLNSLFIAIVSTSGNVVVSSLVAYSFAKIELQYKNALFLVVLATVMIPYQVTLIPLFVIFKSIGWINTYLPLIVPGLFGTATNVFLMRQYIMRIPDAYRDSAYIDGCGHIRIWWSIVMPMSIPMVVSIAVLAFMGKWNEFLGPMLYLNSRLLMPVPLVLSMYRSEFSTKWHLLMAASCTALVPIIALYLVSQKYIISGIMLGGIKG